MKVIRLYIQDYAAEKVFEDISKLYPRLTITKFPNDLQENDDYEDYYMAPKGV